MSNELEAYVHWVTNAGLPKAVKVSDIKESVANDTVLTACDEAFQK